MSVRVIHGDCLAEIPKLVADGIVVDSVVCDPPYNLEAMAKRFGPGQKAATSPNHQRFAKGFMGMTWDTDIAFRPETWATVATILRPGAFLVAFGGTRTHHRVWSAIEDGGFVIQDTIAWLFGSGFPKRRDMLKPAFEPICLAYKPGGKRTMQVDECRIESSLPVQSAAGSTGFSAGRADNYILGTGAKFQNIGRWPANVVHDSSDEVMAAFPDSAASKAAPRGSVQRYDPASDETKRPKGGNGVRGHDDIGGSAARFFYSAKADAEDRFGSRHPTCKPVALIAWLVKLVCPPGGTFLDPFAGSGTAAVTALKTGRNAILIEREDAYYEDIKARLAHYEGEGRHSLASKARRAPEKPLGGLFERPYDAVADAVGSYSDAVKMIGERHKAGEPIPEFFLPHKTAE